jgi:hypothetical protein
VQTYALAVHYCDMTTSRFLFLDWNRKIVLGTESVLFVVTSLVMTSLVVLSEEPAREPAGLAACLKKKVARRAGRRALRNKAAEQTNRCPR